jgi:hypothetical protein
MSYVDFLTESPVVQTLMRHGLTVGLSATSPRTAVTGHQLLDGDLFIVGQADQSALGAGYGG